MTVCVILCSLFLTCSGFQLVKEKSCSEGQMALFSCEVWSPAGVSRTNTPSSIASNRIKLYKTIINHTEKKSQFIFTHEWRCRDWLRRRRGVRGLWLQKCHVGRKEELTATALTEQNGQEHPVCAAFIKRWGHLVKHGVHLGQAERDGTIEYAVKWNKLL